MLNLGAYQIKIVLRTPTPLNTFKDFSERIASKRIELSKKYNLVVRGQPNEFNFTEVNTKFRLGRLASDHITSATKAAQEYAKFYLELLKDDKL